MVPTLYYVDTESNSLYMELVPGSSAKQHIQSAGMDAAGLAALAIKIGKAVALLHDGGVVHGDLTTSNMILRESDGALVRAYPLLRLQRPVLPAGPVPSYKYSLIDKPTFTTLRLSLSVLGWSEWMDWVPGVADYDLL